MSIRIGVLSSAMATGIALFFSLGIWMLKPRLAPVLIGIALLPMLAPPVVSALTLYFFLIALSKVNGVVAYDTWLGVALAHVVMIAPFAVVLITVALAQVDRRIDLAARAMGAGLGTRIFRVILPNIRFGVLAALFLTFMLSWEEIGVTIFITSVECHHPAPADVDGSARQYRPGDCGDLGRADHAGSDPDPRPGSRETDAEQAHKGRYRWVILGLSRVRRGLPFPASGTGPGRTSGSFPFQNPKRARARVSARMQKERSSHARQGRS